MSGGIETASGFKALEIEDAARLGGGGQRKTEVWSRYKRRGGGIGSKASNLYTTRVNGPHPHPIALPPRC